MSDMMEARQRLQSAVRKVRRTVNRVRERKESISEAGTKEALIRPVLTALGWDTSDIDEVKLEYKHKPKDNPVDYGLFVQGSPRLFIEAKALDTNLDDYKWQRQVINYASAAGVEWCVLTDGDRYCIYNALAPVDVERKLFRTVAICDSTQEDAAFDTLELLSKDKLSQGLIKEPWEAHFVDSQVRAVLEGMFDTQDNGLARLVKKKARELKPSQIRDSLRRADIVVNFPALSPSSAKEPQPDAREEHEEGKTSQWGPRSYRGPLLLDGNVVVLTRYRPFLKTVKSERVSVDTVRGTAETAHALAQAGQAINLPAIREYPTGPTSQNATQRALGALCIAGAIVFTESHHTDHFAIADNLSPEEMVERVLSKAQPMERAAAPSARVARTATSSGEAKQLFRWLLTMREDGAFVIDCRYLPDETKSFQVRGRRAPADEDFKPARRKLFEDIYEQIKPLFPDLPDGRVRAKAWSGVHKVYPASAYGKK